MKLLAELIVIREKTREIVAMSENLGFHHFPRSSAEADLHLQIVNVNGDVEGLVDSLIDQVKSVKEKYWADYNDELSGAKEDRALSDEPSK